MKKEKPVKDLCPTKTPARLKTAPQPRRRPKAKFYTEYEPPEPFSADLPPLVPGQPGADVAFCFWRQERELDALRSQQRHYQEHIYKLNGVLIEALILCKGGKPSMEALNRVACSVEGVLLAQAKLLEGLLSAGVEVHPLLGQMVLQHARKEGGDGDK